MRPLNTAHWPGLVVGAVLLANVGLPMAHGADPESGQRPVVTLWDTVRTGMRDLAAIGANTVRSLVSWFSGPGGGSSRLASELLTFTGTNLGDLEVLVGQAGYRLEEITIHPGNPGEVTLGFTWQSPVDARHQADLQDLIAGSSAQVDDDTRAIVRVLLDAATDAQAVPFDRFRFQRVQVGLGEPTIARLGFRVSGKPPVNGPVLPPAGTDPRPMPADRSPPGATDTSAPVAASALPSAPDAAPAVPPGPVTPATRDEEPPGSGPTYRIVGTKVNGHAGPGRHQPVLRTLTPADRLRGTGNRRRNWIEVTLEGGGGAALRLWVYDSVVMPAP